MTYVVLARKWRPQSFEELTGQEHVARTLQNAIQAGRIPHAILLTGPRGVGKTSSARIIAMALNCEHGPTPTPCGVCQACIEVKSGRSVDILEIDGASNRGINEIRELRDSVQYAPSRDRYKVYIIDEVHMLTTEAFNALLKTLEEPPPHVVFIFATTEAQKIPVTILSRCQRFDFRNINLPDLIARLAFILEAEGIQAEPEALHMIARQAAGGMRDALSLLDQVISSSDGNITAERTADLLGAADRRQLFLLSDAVIRRDTAAALITLQNVLSRGTDVSWFAAEFASHLRDLAVLAVAGSAAELAIMTDDELISAQAQVRATDGTTLETLLDIMIQAAEEISRSSMGELRFELALIRMCEIATRHSIDYLIALLERHAGIESELPPVPANLTPWIAAPISASTEAGTVPAAGKPAPSPSAAARPNLAPPVATPVAAPSAAAAQVAAPSAAAKPVAAPDEVPAPNSVLESIREPTPEGTPEPEPVEDPLEHPAPEPAVVPVTVPMPEPAQPPVEEPTPQPLEAPAPEPTQQQPVEEPLGEATREATVSLDARTDAPAAFETAAHPITPADSKSEPKPTPELQDEPAKAATAATAPSGAAALGGDLVVPCMVTWRQVVNELGEGFAMARRMLVMGHCLAEGGVFRVGISSSYLQDRELLQDEFGGITARVFGHQWTLELVEDTTFTAVDRARAWRIRNEEEAEEEALRARIHQRLNADPLIQMVKRRWPDYVLRREHIHFRLETSSNLSSGEDEL